MDKRTSIAHKSCMVGKSEYTLLQSKTVPFQMKKKAHKNEKGKRIKMERKRIKRQKENV